MTFSVDEDSGTSEQVMQNRRIRWEQLPETVRWGVENILGGTVIQAESQAGGFSPGSADRLCLDSGRRVFVKAVCASVNADSAQLHRREAAITGRLPAGTPAPTLLGVHDDGTWLALILSDVAGRHPREPWCDGELQSVLDALAAMAKLPVPDEAGLAHLNDELRDDFSSWATLAERPMESLDPWALAHSAELQELSRCGLTALAGDALVHGDLRADNILLTQSGPILIDWPWATLGAPWFDALSVLMNARVLNPRAEVDHWIQSHAVFSEAAPDSVNGVLAGFSGYFLEMSRRPAPAGIPTLRAFQRRQGDAVLAWLKERLGDSSAG